MKHANFLQASQLVSVSAVQVSEREKKKNEGEIDAVGSASAGE
jgi:hypothetical protein